MMEMSFDDLIKTFNDVVEKVEDNVEEAINVNAEDLLSKSVNLAPLDEGGLRENGSVKPAVKEGKEIAAYVGYSKEYALRMHEDVYNAQVAGTGRKYLSKPTNENAEEYSAYIAKKVRSGFK